MLPDGYAIRAARPDELDRCTEIERAAAVRFAEVGLAEVMSTVVTPRVALEQGLRERGLFVAVDASDRPVGFSLVTVLDDEAHLLELDVVPEHGRKGLGRALVVAAMAWGLERGLPRLTLSTLDFVAFNAPFYQGLGFRVLEELELGPELRAGREHDRERGLPHDGRVIMGRELPTRRAR